MNIRFHSVSTALAVLLAMAGTATAATVHYDIDPEHTFPSCEADHLAGLSVWRGKFNRSSGEIALDRAAGTGAVEVVVDMASIDFGHDKLNEHARGAELFDATKYPQATSTGQLRDFVRSEEHTSELQSLMSISYAVFCLKQQ